MNKKAKLALAVKQKFMTSFLKCKNLLTKHTSKNASKKMFLLRRYFLALIIIVIFFLRYVVMLLYGLLSNFLLCLIGYF